ncbi:MAG: transcriptional regulator [Roseburia sp.]|nr:transcriptional regulator [Roseburia sp.]
MISEDVRELRTCMGMNRREFCDYFSIPYRTMSDWEAGKRKMPEYLLKLMEYKARVENLINEDNSMEEIK